MTKRAYPFECGVLRQFKMHINNYECDKESRREIQSYVERYFTSSLSETCLLDTRQAITIIARKLVLDECANEAGKTMEKLFSAQKNCQLTNYHNNCEIHLTKSGKNLVQKQVSSYFVYKGPNAVSENLRNIIVNKGMTGCSYCDCITECTFTCNVCSKQYCQACSFADYNADSDEIRICLTCS